jgi:hypothetical protein
VYLRFIFGGQIVLITYENKYRRFTTWLYDIICVILNHSNVCIFYTFVCVCINFDRNIYFLYMPLLLSFFNFKFLMIWLLYDPHITDGIFHWCKRCKLNGCIFVHLISRVFINSTSISVFLFPTFLSST